jgi:hypothetical protein
MTRNFKLTLFSSLARNAYTSYESAVMDPAKMSYRQYVTNTIVWDEEGDRFPFGN